MGRPLTILIAALGGEGGGVLAEWIVEAATKAGLPVQATSVPGVAQRTGSTSYYIEVMPTPDPKGRAPVFALVPTAGLVDVAIASELLEAARLLERGFVSPDRTTFIASSSRVYTTAEKMQMGDGRFDGEKAHEAARALAKRYVTLDLEALAQRHGTVVSATMFGAMAGAGVFPWPRAVCEAAIQTGGRGAAASLRGFAAAFDAAAAGQEPRPEPAPEPPPAPVGADFAGLPAAARAVVAHGVARCVDYQDEAYGELFLDRVRALASAAPAGDPRVDHAVEEA
ncbi:MAG TPA: 2-oxoacid:acceptor oxidoreductase family protein, partial [Beijerinckiaceae bacterium]